MQKKKNKIVKIFTVIMVFCIVALMFAAIIYFTPLAVDMGFQTFNIVKTIGIGPALWWFLLGLFQAFCYALVLWGAYFLLYKLMFRKNNKGVGRYEI